MVEVEDCGKLKSSSSPVVVRMATDNMVFTAGLGKCTICSFGFGKTMFHADTPELKALCARLRKTTFYTDQKRFLTGAMKKSGAACQSNVVSLRAILSDMKSKLAPWAQHVWSKPSAEAKVKAPWERFFVPQLSTFSSYEFVGNTSLLANEVFLLLEGSVTFAGSTASDIAPTPMEQISRASEHMGKQALPADWGGTITVSGDDDGHLFAIPGDQLYVMTSTSAVLIRWSSLQPTEEVFTDLLPRIVALLGQFPVLASTPYADFQKYLESKVES